MKKCCICQKFIKKEEVEEIIKNTEIVGNLEKIDFTKALDFVYCVSDLVLAYLGVNLICKDCKTNGFKDLYKHMSKIFINA